MLKSPVGSVTYEQMAQAGLKDSQILSVAKEMSSSHLLREAYAPEQDLKLPSEIDFQDAVSLLHKVLHNEQFPFWATNVWLCSQAGFLCTFHCYKGCRACFHAGKAVQLCQDSVPPSYQHF